MRQQAALKHYIGQSEYQVSNAPNVCFQTVLGSCVATCLFDPAAQIGGMNHLVLPMMNADPFSALAPVNDMETLINEMIKLGAMRARLIAKLFGGAQMHSSNLAIGQTNAQFVTEFLETERIPIKASSLGGRSARRIRFWPNTGKVQQRLVVSAPVEEPTRPVKDLNGFELL